MTDFSLKQFLGRYDVEIGWWAFVVLNAWAMLMLREWATVPFHFIWIGVALMYGWRVWTLRATWGALAVIIAITGFSLIRDVLGGFQEPDELTEIPLMATVFLVMVLYVRREVSAKEQTEQVSRRNLELLDQETRFVQDASHMLRTPLTVALGHAEVLRLSATDPDSLADIQVIIDELNRLRTITDQLLALASSENPDFVNRVETDVDELLETVLARWARTEPRVRAGRLDPGEVLVDRERIRDALDELIRNALGHAPAESPVTVASHRVGGSMVLSVTDRGPGISEDDQRVVFDRWARLSTPRTSGVGLGLAIVKAITEAQGGSVGLISRIGEGSTFEIRLPLLAAGQADQSQVSDVRVP